MSEDMRDAFVIFAGLYKGKGLEMRELRPHFNHNQVRNFSKLQFCGIIDLESGTRWHLTKTGEDFLAGRMTILTPWAWMEAKPLPEDHPAWQTFRGKRRRIGIDTPLGRGLKGREGYQKEKRGDTLLSDEQLEAIESGKKKGVESMLQTGKYEHQVPAMIEKELQHPAQPSMFGQNVTDHTIPS